MSDEGRQTGLGRRADAVFARFLSERGEDLHPADHAEAAAFWDWLGEFERPAAAAPAPPRYLGWAAAAAVLAVVGASATWLATRGDGPSSRPDVAQHFTTGIAERRVVRLADGSVVTLAPATRVDVRYSASARRLRLAAGEALFAVAHNSRRPFLVQTPYGEVKAVGTAFDVTLARREAKVVVVEGVVRIALRTDAGGGESSEPIVKLARKGESVAFGTAAGDVGTTTGFIRQSRPVDATTATAWTRGKLIFQGEPLADVVAKVNLYARDRLVVADPGAARTPVYGVVDQGDVTAIRDLIDTPDAVRIDVPRPRRASPLSPSP